MTQPPLPQSRLDEQRERTVVALCDHFANDRLEMAELERRLDLVHQARTPADLEALLSDLAAPASAAPAPERTVGRALESAREAVKDTRTYLAFMGGVERRGSWVPARRNVVIAIMGGVELDFRDVELPPGETEVFVFCLMGGADIIVPPDLRVDASGIAIMGGFGHSSSSGPADPNAPLLRINGFCLMGGADITVRLPGESGRDAARRRREEKRLQREQQRLQRRRDLPGSTE